MRLTLKTLLTAVLSAWLLISVSGVSATSVPSDESSSEASDRLVNCEDMAVDGVRIQCPDNLKQTRIIQVFNPAADKGTSPASACVCNATFVECDPNKTEGKEKVPLAESSKSYGLPACHLGFIRSVPSEVELLGNNTTYCVTRAAKRTCYTR